MAAFHIPNHHLLGFGQLVGPYAALEKHPAKFSAGFIDQFRELLIAHLQEPWKFPEPLILDPFAGVGTIHELRPEFITYGYEIEAEWAACSPYTICGDSTKLPAEWNNTFAAVVTSPTYGNRMADHHEAKDDSQRNTYRHTLGRPLSDNNTGQFQATQQSYWDLHKAVYEQCWRVIEPDGLMIVNVSNHIRKGEEINVSDRHADMLRDIGFSIVTIARVETQRNGFGQNGQLRVDHEKIYVYRKVL